MATSTKIINKQQVNRRTLRSNAKNNHPQNPQSAQSFSDDRTINQIKIEIDHQQTNNLTKTTLQICQDLKIQQHFIIKNSPHFQNQINQQPAQNISSPSHNNIFGPKPSELSLQVISNSIEQKLSIQPEVKQFISNNFTPYKVQPFKKQITQPSPYFGERKSYRNIKKEPNNIIPYRKCQDQIQHKIVGLINKMCLNKHNEKQIDNFAVKIHKISNKDLYNPYVVSGIQTILKICQKSLQNNTNTCLKLKNEVNKMSERIWNGLSKTDEYQSIFHQRRHIDLTEIRPKLLRRIHNILVKDKKLNSCEAKQKSFYACQALFGNNKEDITYQQIIEFLKESKFLNY